MKAKLLLGALVVCGLLAIPNPVAAGCCGGSGLFNGCGLFSGNIVSRIRARRIARISNRIERLEGERSVLIDGKRPRAACKDCKDDTCDLVPAPEVEDGAFLEVQSPGILSNIVSLDVGVLNDGGLLDCNCGLLGGGAGFRIPSPGAILSSVGLGGCCK